MRIVLALVAVMGLCAPAGAEIAFLRKGETGAHALEVTADDRRVLITFQWRDPAARMGVSLVSPSGTRVSGAVRGVAIHAEPYGYRVVLEPGASDSLGWAGTWTARLHCRETPSARKVVPYLFGINRGLPVRLDLEGLGGVHRAGGSSVVTALVRSEKAADGSISVDSCAATVVSQGEGTRRELVLRDDGHDPDTVAGDGSYAGRIDWTAPGDYVVAVAVTGTHSGERAFRRDVWKHVEVRAAGR